MEALIFQRAICLAVGYVFGMFQTGYIVGRVMHVDIRKKGSGNAGSTNAVRVLGWKAGAVTFFGDVLKCILAVLLMRFVFRESDCLPLLVVYTGMGVLYWQQQSILWKLFFMAAWADLVWNCVMRWNYIFWPD